MSYTRTSTYVTLEIAQSSFDDIKQRLERVGVFEEYEAMDREHGEMILFDGIGLVVDKTSVSRKPGVSCNEFFVCAFHDTGGPKDRLCSVLTYRPGLR